MTAARPMPQGPFDEARPGSAEGCPVGAIPFAAAIAADRSKGEDRQGDGRGSHRRQPRHRDVRQPSRGGEPSRRRCRRRACTAPRACPKAGDAGISTKVFFFPAVTPETGRDLWVTDGTAAGTEMLVDQDNVLPQGWPEANRSVDHIPGVGPLWDPRTLPDGRLIYNAVYSPEEGPNRSTDPGTDGTVSGTVRLGQTPHAPQPAPDPVTFRLEADEGFYPASFRGGSAQQVDGRLVHGARTDYRLTEPLGAGGTQVATYSIGDLPWITDGTLEGTAPVPGAEVRLLRPDHFLQLGPDQWLFDVIREPTGANELWVTDGTPQGTAFVTDEFDLARLDRPSFTPLGDGQALLTLRDTDHGREPWLFDVADGSLDLLADLNPGTASSSPAWWLVAQEGQFSPGLAGQLLTCGGEPLSGMTLTLRLADGRTIDVTADAGGRFAFEDAELAGAEIPGPSWTAVEGPAITTGSALQVLRLPVGLQPSWGLATALDFSPAMKDAVAGFLARRR